MDSTTKSIICSLTKNATCFLNCSIEAINRGLHIYSNKIIAIVNMQMTLELAMKARIVEKYGVPLIVKGLDVNASEEEIREKYENNSFEIKEFDRLKNFLKSEQLFDFTKTEFKYMDRFQTYRNKLVHFNYNFSVKENEQIEQDIFYVLVFLLGTIMSNALKSDDPTYMQKYINGDQYKKLMQNQNYLTALNAFLVDNYRNTYYCPICSRKTLTPSKKCLGCLCDLSADSFTYGYIDCKYCHMESSVIYDKLNINHNNGITRGICISCQTDTILYKCIHCGKVCDLEGIEDKCTPELCLNKD